MAIPLSPPACRAATPHKPPEDAELQRAERREGHVERTDTSPSDLIESVPDEFRDDMRLLHAAISSVLGGLPVTVWQGKFWGGSDQNIVGYGDFSYERPGGKTVDWFIAGLAAQKNYISVYVTAIKDGKYLTEEYTERLGKAKIGKSSISFRSVEDIDLDALLDLVREARILMAGT